MERNWEIRILCFTQIHFIFGYKYFAFMILVEFNPFQRLTFLPCFTALINHKIFVTRDILNI